MVVKNELVVGDNLSSGGSNYFGMGNEVGEPVGSYTL